MSQKTSPPGNAFLPPPGPGDVNGNGVSTLADQGIAAGSAVGNGPTARQGFQMTMPEASVGCPASNRRVGGLPMGPRLP